MGSIGGRWSKIRAKKVVRTKNPSLLLQTGPLGGGAISAGAVFGHFSLRNHENGKNLALSLYNTPQRGKN